MMEVLSAADGIDECAEGLVSERRADPGEDLYRLLGVDPTVDAPALARAYRRRLRQLHPDTRAAAAGAERSGDDGEQAAATRTAELAAVQHAYQVLRDPGRRIRYDAERRSQTAPMDTGGSAGVAGSHGRGQARPTVRITVRVRSAPPGEQFPIRVGPVRIEPLPRPAR